MPGRTTRTRSALLIAAACSLVAAGATAGPASAAAPSGPELDLRALGEGAALRITINLPAEAGPLGRTIEQTISLTDGSVTTKGPSAVSEAKLGKGTTPVLSGLLDRGTKATLAGPRSQNAAAADVSRPGLQLRLLPQSSRVADPVATTRGELARSTTGVARIGITAAVLPDGFDAVTKPVSDALGTAIGGVNNGTGAATGAVGTQLKTALDRLDAAAGDRTAPLSDPAREAVDETRAALARILAKLEATVRELDGDVSLLSVDAITGEQVITRNGQTVTSTVENALSDLDVLGGLVHVDAVRSRATASAGGVPGSAKASTDAPLFTIDIAEGALRAIVDEKGIRLDTASSSALPPELQKPVADALGSVQALLQQVAGVQVTFGKGTTDVRPDGTAAEASVAATKLVVAPAVLANALGGKPLVTVELVRGNVAVGVQELPQTFGRAEILPKTGPGLPSSWLLGGLLLTAAFVVRRWSVSQA